MKNTCPETSACPSSRFLPVIIGTLVATSFALAGGSLIALDMGNAAYGLTMFLFLPITHSTRSRQSLIESFDQSLFDFTTVRLHACDSRYNRNLHSIASCRIPGSFGSTPTLPTRIAS